MKSGKVFLVGAGPGDPELLTLKALRLIRSAEVIVYDRLVGEEILEFVSPDKEMIFVGKTSGRHTLPQESINQVLIEKAQEGKQVVRLKGGDPFIFGRGGEEALACKNAGIPFEIIPGITAANAVAAYAGIPLTHRGISQCLTLITGHIQQGEQLPDLNWSQFTSPNQTLVFYMALSTLPQIVERLTGHGLSPQTPIAVIENGTLDRQRTVVATLDLISHEVERAHVQSPCLIVVGQVVALREELQWFEQLSEADMVSVASGMSTLAL
ncbi:MAG: uroporphyrinogen-III C-methyltransferase [SAR324 cluster bacterium]|nr:uroporphyrinogen-III C-methyltransferase [SAR324 cluster bacterium]